MSAERDVSPESSSGGERQGLQPRYRRGFGCVTWTYMGILAFLAAAFLLLLPFRYVGDGSLFRLLGGLSGFGLFLILPGTALAALVGARTYRSQVRRSMRSGAGVGAIIGWTSFFTIAWLTSILPPPPGAEGASLVSSGAMSGFIRYVFAPLVLVATCLILYALLSRKINFERGRTLILAGAVLAGLAGLAVLFTDFGFSNAAGVLVSAVSGAFGGWVAGFGYARTGGDEMIPPGSTIRPRGPRGGRGQTQG